MNQIGVYMIRNRNNGKVYIGSTVNLTARWRSHRNNLKAGTHSNSYLQASWLKHGPEVFEFVVLTRCAESELLRFEQDQIEAHRAAHSAFPIHERQDEQGCAWQSADVGT